MGSELKFCPKCTAALSKPQKGVVPGGTDMAVYSKCLCGVVVVYSFTGVPA